MDVCSGQTGHSEVVLVVFEQAKITCDRLFLMFWESHDPTQGMRQGNDLGTQYRSCIYYSNDRQREAAEASRVLYQRALSNAGHGPDLDRAQTCRTVLLRGGIPPAVSGQEPRRLLRSRWDGRVLRVATQRTTSSHDDFLKAGDSAWTRRAPSDGGAEKITSTRICFGW